MYYSEISKGDEFIYKTNEALDQLVSYIRPRQEQMYGKKFIKYSPTYAYGFNEDDTIRFGFLYAPDGLVVVETTGKKYDLSLEEVIQRLDKPLEYYIYYMEDQLGKRQGVECTWATKPKWGSGVFAEDPTTGERFCLRSNYDSSG